MVEIGVYSTVGYGVKRPLDAVGVAEGREDEDFRIGLPCAAVRSVSAAPGATVRCEGEAIAVKGLRLDASGAGTIDGFALADVREHV